jgi:glycine cleavage system H protein
MKKYTKDHEWLEKVDGEVYKVGITEYAQEQLGDVILVELPEVGDSFSKEDEMVVVESVKAASDVYAPVSGQVVSVNEQLANDPALVNESAEQDGWLLEMEVEDSADLDNLLSKADYKKFVAENE